MAAAQRRLYNYLTYPQLDLSGGMQRKTSHLLKKRNEVKSSKNAAFNIKIGSAVRRPGYELAGNVIQPGNDSLGAIVYKYGQTDKVICGVNDPSNTFATLRYWNTDNTWPTILPNAPANMRFNMLNDLDQLYVAGQVPNTVTYMNLTNIDSTLIPSTSRNVYNAPPCRFIAEYSGQLVAINCRIGNKDYSDRAYFSSPPLGAITFVQTDQTGLLNGLRVDSVQYLKVGMQIDIYGAGTENLKNTGVTIVSVDKKNKRIGFVAQSFTVADNDEIWLSGTKGTLSRFWNTDYPNPESSDFIRVPPGKESRPTFTGHGKNNNRLFLFTKNSFLKFDGSNLTTVSNTIGCVSHETIQNIGSWTIWLHTTGVWGYNDNTGDFKLLSRGIEPYIQAINQSNLPYSSAGVVGKVYKLSLGELLPLDSVTTSTSTSSTTVTTTSTSTSSTSTSSTSASSTTTNTSTTTTTVVTTTSTSSTSTSSTTTLASIKKVARLCYDFDMNAWWGEEHKREIRFQFNHTMNGYTKPYFTDETGRLWRDETGNLDGADTIPMEIEWGRNNFGTDQLKLYLSCMIDSENARGGIMQYALDSGPFNTLGQTVKTSTKISFPTKAQFSEGHDINYKFVHNDAGDPPAINGMSTYFKIQELILNEL